MKRCFLQQWRSISWDKTGQDAPTWMWCTSRLSVFQGAAISFLHRFFFACNFSHVEQPLAYYSLVFGYFDRGSYMYIYILCIYIYKWIYTNYIYLTLYQSQGILSFSSLVCFRRFIPPKKGYALKKSTLRVPRSSPYPACGTSGFRSDRRWFKCWRFLWGVKGPLCFWLFSMEFPGSLNRW